MDNALNQDVASLDSVQDEVPPRWEDPKAPTKVVATPTGVRVLTQQEKPAVEGLEEAICDFDTAALDSE